MSDRSAASLVRSRVYAHPSQDVGESFRVAVNDVYFSSLCRSNELDKLTVVRMIGVGNQFLGPDAITSIVQTGPSRDVGHSKALAAASRYARKPGTTTSALPAVSLA